MTQKAIRSACDNRRRIHFNLYQKYIETKQTNEESKKEENAVCFWTDEKTVSER